MKFAMVCALQIGLGWTNPIWKKPTGPLPCQGQRSREARARLFETESG